MTVNRYATQAGKKFEPDVMKYLREGAYDVERLRLTGAEDEGDLLLRVNDLRYVLELKRTKGFDLAGWVRQAEIERDNYLAHRDMDPALGMFAVVHYARGKGLGGSYVTTTLDEWLRDK